VEKITALYPRLFQENVTGASSPKLQTVSTRDYPYDFGCAHAHPALVARDFTLSARLYRGSDLGPPEYIFGALVRPGYLPEEPYDRDI
jgi:hypothetical protein